mgnify:CR=1 FL=1
MKPGSMFFKMVIPSICSMMPSPGSPVLVKFSLIKIWNSLKYPFNTVSRSFPRFCGFVAEKRLYKSSFSCCKFSLRLWSSFNFFACSCFRISASRDLSWFMRVNESLTLITLWISATNPFAFSWSFSQQVEKASNSVIRLSISLLSLRCFSESSFIRSRIFLQISSTASTYG